MSKVLTIKEPFASLIAEEIKHVETRSWRTSYRGEIYIHAGKAKVNLKDKRINNLISLLNNQEMKYGQIIVKANLIDCVPMTSEYIEKIKKNNNEYISGHYEEGRYGWVLDNIEILAKPIPINGQLGIWNYSIEKGK
jgi:ASCH domain.